MSHLARRKVKWYFIINDDLDKYQVVESFPTGFLTSYMIHKKRLSSDDNTIITHVLLRFSVARESPLLDEIKCWATKATEVTSRGSAQKLAQMIMSSQSAHQADYLTNLHLPSAVYTKKSCYKIVEPHQGHHFSTPPVASLPHRRQQTPNQFPPPTLYTPYIQTLQAQLKQQKRNPSNNSTAATLLSLSKRPSEQSTPTLKPPPTSTPAPTENTTASLQTKITILEREQQNAILQATELKSTISQFQYLGDKVNELHDHMISLQSTPIVAELQQTATKLEEDLVVKDREIGAQNEMLH